MLKRISIVLFLIGIVVSVSSCNKFVGRNDFLSGTKWVNTGSAFDINRTEQYLEFFGRGKMVYKIASASGEKRYEGRYNIIDESNVSFNLSFPCTIITDYHSLLPPTEEKPGYLLGCVVRDSDMVVTTNIPLDSSSYSTNTVTFHRE